MKRIDSWLRVPLCFLWITAIYLAPRDVYAQTAADSARLREQVARLVQARDLSNNSRGVKTILQQAIAAESLWLKVTTPPPPPVNQAPVAVIRSVVCDSTRRCVATDGSTDDKAVTARAWNWSDGATSTALNPSHTYASYGAYTLTLVVRDIEGRADTATRAITLTSPAPVNSGPTASFSKSYDPTTRTVAVNAGASKDDKAITEYKWTWGDGGSSLGVTATHRYIASGTFAISLTVRDAEGLSATTSQTQPVAIPDTIIVADSGNAPPPPDTGSIATRAELPRAVPTFTIPTSTRVVNVAAVADLQAAINAAQGGDELRLAAGATFIGPINLPSRPCGSWVTVTTNTALPPAGVRVTPTSAASFAKIITNSSEPAIRTRNPTCGWRFVGLEVSASAASGVVGQSLNYGIVWIGDGGWLGGGETVRSVSTQPQQILLDRVYIHGAPTTNTTRCLFLNAGAAIVRDSYISDCHAQGSDAQAILLCNGTGPTLIENNYLAGAAENIMAGGCDPVDATLIPSDITIRRNHVDKPTAWKSQGWLIKNLFELKNARRVLVEQNVFTNTWIAGQMGMAIVLKSSTETCAACTWEGTKDVTFRYNIVRSAHRGLNIQAIDGSSAGTTASHTERITVTDNLFTEIGASNGITPSDGWLNLLTHDLKDITIHRNTFISNAPGYGLDVYLAYCGGGQMQRLDIRNNIYAGQSYYAITSDASANHAAALTACAGNSWRFTGNVVSQVDQQFQTLNPPGNVYVDAIAKLGLTASGASTVFPTKGADISEIQRRTQGVVIAP